MSTVHSARRTGVFFLVGFQMASEFVAFWKDLFADGAGEEVALPVDSQMNGQM